MNPVKSGPDFMVIHTYVPSIVGPVNFSFTKGLEGLGFKELCMYGVEYASSLTVLNKLARLQLDGELKTDHKYPELFVGFDLIIKEVSLRDSVKRYGSPDTNPVHAKEMLQVVWPDEKNLFPWEESYDETQRALQYKLYR